MSLNVTFCQFWWKSFKVIITFEWNHLIKPIATCFLQPELLSERLFYHAVFRMFQENTHKQKCWIFKLKMAVKVTKGQIWNGTISKNWCHQEYYYLSKKFHTCIKTSQGWYHMLFYTIPTKQYYSTCLH